MKTINWFRDLAGAMPLPVPTSMRHLEALCIAPKTPIQGTSVSIDDQTALRRRQHVVSTDLVFVYEGKPLGTAVVAKGATSGIPPRCRPVGEG